MIIEVSIVNEINQKDKCHAISLICGVYERADLIKVKSIVVVSDARE